jgi:hypothetical protein
VPAEDAEAPYLRRWLSKDQTDIRDDIRVAEEVLAFITEAGAKSDGTAGQANACTRIGARSGRPQRIGAIPVAGAVIAHLRRPGRAPSVRI